MLEKIRFQKSVPDDLEKILSAYAAKSPVAANKVRDEIKQTLEFIELFPEMYAVVEDDIRLVRTKSYPLLIQYCIVDDIPIVLSIYHSDLDEIKRFK